MPAKPLALAFLQDILLSSATGRELLSCIERVRNVATDVNLSGKKSKGNTAYYKGGLAGAIYRKET